MQPTRFKMTRSARLLCIRWSRTAFFPSLVILGNLVSHACAGELDDPEQYTTRVRPGLGASGVTPPRGIQADTSDPPVQPSVSPQQTSVSPAQTTGSTATSDTTSNVAPTTGVSAECADAPTRILEAKCDGGGCHGTADTPSTSYSNLASSSDPMTLLDVPAKFTCADKMLIDSKNPAESAILSVIQASGHCSSSQMPFLGPYLSTAEVDCLTEWVNAVASGAL
jgi:hypothetical protein